MPNKICIYAICKNEINFVDRWFSSIQNADYICVLDTGSTDGTYEALLRLKETFPNKVFIKQKIISPWRFDTARNESMKLIPEDTTICVSADLDDVFRSDWYDVILDDIKLGYNKIIGQYQYYANEVPTECTNLDRISLYGQAHWEGALHERLVCKNVREIHDNRFTVEHRQDLTKDRRELYFETAKTAVNESDPYSLLCFGYECHNYGKYEDSVRYFTKLYELLPKDSEYLTRKWVKLLAETYQLLGNHKEYEHWLKEALKVSNQQSPFEDAYLYNGDLETQLLKLKNKICIYAMCKNEKQFVEQWLESMSEADYIVVLDTGSTDGTYELLKADPRVTVCEQKIISPWRFDVARNESMKLIPEDANILMSTDLDELLDKGWSKPLREQWVEGRHKRGYYTYAWSHNTSGEPARVFTYDKIHSRDWHWEFPVHEMLVLPDGTQDIAYDEIINFGDTIYLHHWPDQTKSRGSYLGLLELRKQEYENDYYGRIYLAHEYHYRGFYRKAIDELKDILAIHEGECASVEKASCYLFMGDAHRALAEYDKAIGCYYQALFIDETYREPYYALADLFNFLQQFEFSIPLLEKCLEKTYRHYVWLERDDAWAGGIYDLLGVAYYWVGQYDKSYMATLKALKADPTNERLQTNLNFAEQKLEIK